ncbi:hypothetical protein CPB97_007274 [Podila verticillata]|nr:hypothetical protein CPB97_007274 [Podila verticillata]
MPVGLGQFSTKSGLSSLHSTFLKYFVQMAHSLGYVVVGVNEYYTSKKCPGCSLFVAQVNMCHFYCPYCHVYHHRDVMAAENMANIMQGHLLKQERPKYLQPVAQDRLFPWKEKHGVGSSMSLSSTITTSTATTSSNKTTGRHKRVPTDSSPDQQWHGKSFRT